MVKPVLANEREARRLFEKCPEQASVYLSVCLFVCLSVCLSCADVCVWACLSFPPSVCLPLICPQGPQRDLKELPNGRNDPMGDRKKNPRDSQTAPSGPLSSLRGPKEPPQPPSPKESKRNMEIQEASLKLTLEKQKNVSKNSNMYSK